MVQQLIYLTVPDLHIRAVASDTHPGTGGGGTLPAVSTRHHWDMAKVSSTNPKVCSLLLLLSFSFSFYPSCFPGTLMIYLQGGPFGVVWGAGCPDPRRCLHGLNLEKSPTCQWVNYVISWGFFRPSFSPNSWCHPFLIDHKIIAILSI